MSVAAMDAPAGRTVAGSAYGVPGGGWPVALAGAVVLAMFSLTPLVAYVGNLGFAPLTALAGLVCLPALVAARRRPSLGAALLLALLVWALVSLAWSPAAPTHFARLKDLMAFTGLKLAFELPLYGSFVAASTLASPQASRRALLILGAGLGLVTVLLLVEAATGAALYQAIKHALHSFTRPDLARRNVARAAYPLALLIWPAGLVLEDRGWRYVTLIMGVCGAASALALNVDAPLVALAAGGGAFLVVRLGRNLGVLAVLAGVIAYFALAPVAVALASQVLAAHADLASHVGKASWGARLEIWRFVAARIGERPLLGWGLDASRIWPGIVPLHPHDGALQLWLELGAPGALMAALVFGWLFSCLAGERTRDPALAAAGAASAVAYVVIGALSFGIWQEWWLALGALAWAAWLLARHARESIDTVEHAGLAPLGAPPATPGLRPLL
ncbi:MAG: O-antigen ligase family protein [Caulobacteraceae bacterium]|nr:O-antigen ligase family protein [Caulobacter sp.]